MFSIVSGSHPGFMLGAREQGADSRSSQICERFAHSLNHSNQWRAGRGLPGAVGREGHLQPQPRQRSLRSSGPHRDHLYTPLSPIVASTCGIYELKTYS